MHVVLFADALQRQAFVALLESDSVHEAVESASPEVANLLRRVIVEEPVSGDPNLGDPVDSVVAVLLREASRRAMAEIEAESRAGADTWRSSAARPHKYASGWTNSTIPGPDTTRLIGW